ncbi:MAG TPA: prolyl oligopeptidase family serine peptidase [Kofleriaceae bacterium]|nr:prolyl oligopeptidase family serine peptidase [Kofleriaceae bacterium]
MRILAALLIAGCSAPATTSAPPVAPQPMPAAVAAEPAAAPAPAPRGFAYPKVPRGDVVETHHGVAVADPYRWLEDMGSPATERFVTEENALTDSYIAKLPQRAVFRKRIAELMSNESFSPPFRRGARYFWTYNDGQHNQRQVWMATKLDGKPSLLLDPNAIATDGSLAFAGLSIDERGARMAYGLAVGGGDWHQWRVREVATGKDLPDQLEHIKYYRPVFTHDGAGLYYSRFPPPAPGKELTEPDHDCKLYFHKLGTDPARDPVVYERTDHPSWQFRPEVTHDGKYLVITIGDGEVGDRGQELISYVDLSKPGSKPVPLIDQYDAEYEFVANDGPLFYFQTNLNAVNKRVIAIDVRDPARDHWKEIVAEGPDAIWSTDVVGKQLFVSTLHDAHTAITAYDLKGKKLREVALPGIGSAPGFLGAPDDTQTFYLFSGFTVPGTVYRYDLATGKSTLWKAPQVPFDAAQLETQQVFFPAKDGTKVPMFITARKGMALDGSNPTIMTAYGFGGISSLPRFSSAMIAWLERGGVSVLVNVRGGGEYGEKWHRASYRATRNVTRDDFIAAGDWLVANKYTAPAHLGIIGGSGGGMLVAEALVHRPDLFGVAMPLAGVHDLLRFQLFGEGAGWQADLGSIDVPEEFAALRATSPLHNVKPGTHYPAVYVVTADHDVRVAPLHSYKLAAALQAAQAGAAPVLLRVETKSGHGGGTTRAQTIEQQSERYAFFAENLGLKVE